MKISNILFKTHFLVLLLVPFYSFCQKSKIENETEKCIKYPIFCALTLDAQMFELLKAAYGVKKVSFQTKDGIDTYVQGNIKNEKMKNGIFNTSGWVRYNNLKAIFVCTSVDLDKKECLFSVLRLEKGFLYEEDLIVIKIDQFEQVSNSNENSTFNRFKTPKNNIFVVGNDWHLGAVMLSDGNFFSFKDLSN